MLRDYTAVDIETTGINPKSDRIIEIGAVKVRDGEVINTFSKLVNPGRELSPFIIQLTGITNAMLKDEEFIESVLPKFCQFCGDDIILGHNIMFDFGFLKQNACNQGIIFEKKAADTLKISRKVLPELESRKLDFLCKYFHLKDENHHRALNDAMASVQLYNLLWEKFGVDFPEIFDAVQLNYSAKKQTSITPRQKQYLKSLIKYHGIVYNIDIDTLSKSEASRIIDKILSEKGRILGV
ncbi:MAG: PolC-type DNA polymerase III [Eubacterium sp.]